MEFMDGHFDPFRARYSCESPFPLQPVYPPHFPADMATSSTRKVDSASQRVREEHCSRHQFLQRGRWSSRLRRQHACPRQLLACNQLGQAVILDGLNSNMTISVRDAATVYNQMGSRLLPEIEHELRAWMHFHNRIVEVVAGKLSTPHSQSHHKMLTGLRFQTTLEESSRKWPTRPTTRRRTRPTMTPPRMMMPRRMTLLWTARTRVTRASRASRARLQRREGFPTLPSMAPAKERVVLEVPETVCRNRHGGFEAVKLTEHCSQSGYLISRNQ